MTKLMDENCSLIYRNILYDFSEISKKIAKWQYIINNIFKLENNQIMIYTEINEEIICLLCAILSTNNSYVPVDIIVPKQRVKSILQKLDIGLIITTSNYIDLCSGHKTLFLDTYVYPKYENLYFNNVIGLGTAYSIFTSGSTGEPKGVRISKKAVMNFITGISTEIDFHKYKNILCITSISFDIFFVETIFALHMGLQVILGDNCERNNPRLIQRLILKYNIEILQITPSRLSLLQIVDPTFVNMKNIKLLILGGEKLSFELFNIIKKKLEAEIYNAYGPTEATIWISLSNITKKEKIDIGLPFLNNNFYLLDENMKPVKKNLIGELYIAGSNLADCYEKNIVETNSKFLYVNSIRVYKTGDLCKVIDGKYYWIGRCDNQVKIRGYRIELEEIENIISGYQGVREVVVIVYQKYETHKKLLIAIIAPNEYYNEKELKKFLEEKIPKYMMPDLLKKIDNLPYTINGKIDRKKIESIIKNNNDAEVKI